MEETLAQLKYQDDYRDKRARLGKLCEDEIEREQTVWAEVNMLKNYSFVLMKMESRLWNEQVVFRRTLDAYIKAHEMQENEARELETVLRETKYATRRHEVKLKKVTKNLEDAKTAWNAELEQVEHMLSEKQTMWQKYENMKEGEKKRQNDMEKEKQLEAATNAMSNSLLISRLSEMNDHVAMHETAFRQIHLATGLTAEKDIIWRYNNRDIYLKEIEDKIVSLQAEVEKLHDTERKINAEAMYIEEDESMTATSGRQYSQKVIKSLNNEAESRHIEKRNKEETNSKLTFNLQLIAQNLDAMRGRFGLDAAVVDTIKFRDIEGARAKVDELGTAIYQLIGQISSAIDAETQGDLATKGGAISPTKRNSTTSRKKMWRMTDSGDVLTKNDAHVAAMCTRIKDLILRAPSENSRNRRIRLPSAGGESPKSGATEFIRESAADAQARQLFEAKRSEARHTARLRRRKLRDESGRTMEYFQATAPPSEHRDKDYDIIEKNIDKYVMRSGGWPHPALAAPFYTFQLITA